jgi:hypothetical protein
MLRIILSLKWDIIDQLFWVFPLVNQYHLTFTNIYPISLRLIDLFLQFTTLISTKDYWFKTQFAENSL